MVVHNHVVGLLMKNFEIWPENPRTNFAHFLLFKYFCLADLLVN